MARRGLVRLAALLDRLLPPAGVRVQLVAAASMWLVGATILLVRGIGYVQGRSWHAWALAAALVIGVLKSRFLLDRVATQAVARIRLRGRDSFLGFFSAKSWLLIALMMGGGILLRQLFVHPGVVGAGILGALYLGIGSALLIADRVFWHAVFGWGSESAPDTP